MTAVPRLAPLEPPYDEAIAATFARVMPPGRAPLLLFRAMARHPRTLQRMFAGALLDKGPLPLRERELLILRTCARCGSEYEWGVHVAFFAAHARFSPAEIGATLAPHPAAFAGREALLLRLADALHDDATLDDALWRELAASFNEAELLEAISLAGYYRTISYMTGALRLPLEADAARFADYQAGNFAA